MQCQMGVYPSLSQARKKTDFKETVIDVPEIVQAHRRGNWCQWRQRGYPVWCPKLCCWSRARELLTMQKLLKITRSFWRLSCCYTEPILERYIREVVVPNIPVYGVHDLSFIKVCAILPGWLKSWRQVVVIGTLQYISLSRRSTPWRM